MISLLRGDNYLHLWNTGFVVLIVGSVLVFPATANYLIALEATCFYGREFARILALCGLVNKYLAPIFPITGGNSATIHTVACEKGIAEAFSVGLVLLLPFLIAQSLTK